MDDTGISERRMTLDERYEWMMYGLLKSRDGRFRNVWKSTGMVSMRGLDATSYCRIGMDDTYMSEGRLFSIRVKSDDTRVYVE